MVAEEDYYFELVSLPFYLFQDCKRKKSRILCLFFSVLQYTIESVRTLNQAQQSDGSDSNLEAPDPQNVNLHTHAEQNAQLHTHVDQVSTVLLYRRATQPRVR